MTKILILLIFIVSCGKPIHDLSQNNEESNALHAPVLEKSLLGLRIFMNFDLLPLRGAVEERGHFWSGDSWRLVKGSINFRWNSLNQEGRFTPLPTPSELKQSSLDEFRNLAPSEKYDIWMGRYDFPLKRQVDASLPQNPENWEGICHGWAGASLNHQEPHPKTLLNPQGLKVSFGAADIKALLSYYYAGVIVEDINQVGKRCDQNGLLEDDNCNDDVSALNFHLILANTLGLRGKSFIADIDRFKEVWNHPILSYESQIIHQDKIMSGRKIHLKTLIKYIDVSERSYWEPTNGTYAQITSQMQFEYELTLDSEGNLQNGKWISRNRPDFIWTVPKVKTFTGYLSGLNELIND